MTNPREIFEYVIAGEPADGDYPRLSAGRGLARALRGLSEPAGGDDALRARLAIAADGAQHVAAGGGAAAGEAT